MLVKRKNEPYSEYWEIPGGFAEYGEKVQTTALREAEEETGLKIDIEGLVGVYSHPDRDPRGHIVSVCFKAKHVDGKFDSDDEILEVKAFSSDELQDMELAFNHKNMLKHASVI